MTAPEIYTKHEFALRRVVQEAITAWPQFDIDESMGFAQSDCEVSGADLVEWFSEWRQRAIAALREDT